MERSMLRLGEAFIASGLAVDLVVDQAKGELLHDVPPTARMIELVKGPVFRARGHGLLADPGSWRLVLQLKRGMGVLKPLVRRLPSLVAYLRDTRPDAVLAAEPRYNLMAVWARRVAGLDCRIILSEHNQVSRGAIKTSPWGQPDLIPSLRRAYLKADAIVAVSNGVADDLAAYAGIPRQRITTVHNPVVGPDLLAKAKQAPDHPWLAPDQPPVILGAGRLHPQKDFRTLIRAFARLRPKRPVRLIILGAASQANPGGPEEMKALAAQLGIADDVDIPGFDCNPFSYMSRASVFVLSSAYEGLGNVLIEALACGTPVVSTDCPSGPREILDNGRYGPLVPVGDVAALAAAISNVLDDPPSSEVLRARAQLFTVERAAKRYLELLLRQDQQSPSAGGSSETDVALADSRPIDIAHSYES
jgi:glycosyltransferase involved in cell wall biosynthesis